MSGTSEFAGWSLTQLRDGLASLNRLSAPRQPKSIVQRAMAMRHEIESRGKVVNRVRNVKKNGFVRYDVGASL